MANTHLIVAIVFAGLFGAAIIWLLIYFVHIYIHHRCLELEHWLRAITPPQWRRPCRHCDGTGRDLNMREKGDSRSRSKGRKGQSRSQSRERSRTRRSPRMIEAVSDWSGEDGRAQRPRQVLPATTPMQRPMVQEQYNPWQGWQAHSGNRGYQMGVAYPQPVMYPQAYPQMYQQPVQQPYVQPSPFVMPAPAPQKQAPRAPIPTHGSVSSAPPYQKPVRKAYTAPPSEPSEPRAAPAKPKAPKHVHRVRETDYIHIVDEYPPIIQDKINAKKAAEKRACSPAPSSSSSSTDSAEEVPRTSIPQAAPRFEPTSFQLPQYPTWTGPVKGPQQGNEQARYASPYMRPDQVRMRVGPEPRQHASSDNFEPYPWRARPRKEHPDDLARRDGLAARESYRRKHRKRRDVDTEDMGPRNEKADSPYSKLASGGSNGKEQPAKQSATRPPSCERVPNMSPMPQPVVEEPPSDAGSTRGENVGS